MSLTFNKFASKVRSIDPYRGSMRYPMDNRSNRQNIFELVETDEGVEFHVSHGYRYEQKPISKARFDMLDGVRGARVFKKTHDHEQFEYYTTDVSPRVLCIVRSDNTLEYATNSFYQGDNMKMTDWMGGYQYDSYRMSGTAYHDHSGKMNHPVFAGLRIDLETHQPTNSNIQVFRRTVNRKRSKDLMASYKEKFKSPDAMLKCMDTDTMIVSIKDILEEHFGEDNKYLSNHECFAIAERMFAEGNNFDGVILHAFAQGIQGFNRWAIDSYQSGNNRSYYRMTEPKNVVPRLITCMAKKLYKEYKPFDEEEVNFIKVRPSQWGIRVVVDGKEVVA
jgi:hypothetical protein